MRFRCGLLTEKNQDPGVSLKKFQTERAGVAAIFLGVTDQKMLSPELMVQFPTI